MSGVQQKQEKWYTFSAGHTNVTPFIEMINLLSYFSVSFKKPKFSMKLFFG